jgi:branched-chain amino acid transport system ATP-binding protein
MIGTHTQFGCSLFDEVMETRRKKRVEDDFLHGAKDLCSEFGISHFNDELVGNLPFGTQRIVEIVRAYASKPKLLLLDEPGCGMNLREIDDLKKMLMRINARGVTLLIIEHNMDIVMDISQRIIVLNHGAKISEGTPQEIQNNPEVINAYLGKVE